MLGAVVIFCGVSVVAAQPLSEQELVQRYKTLLRPLPPGASEKGLAGTESRAVILNLNFKLNSDAIMSEEILYLNALGEAISTDPVLKDKIYKVEGHTCSLGSSQYNLELSRRRANSVVNYLVKHFPLKREQFQIVPYGENNPIASNNTEEGRKRNRRVVIVNTMKRAHLETQGDTKPLVVTARCLRGDRIDELKDNAILTPQDGYAIELFPKKQVYVYVFQVSEDTKLIFPNKEYSARGNPILPGRLYRIPTFGRWFYVEGRPGTEELIVIAGRNPLNDPVQICQRLRPIQVASKKGIGKLVTTDKEAKVPQQPPAVKLSDLFVWRRVFSSAPER